MTQERIKAAGKLGYKVHMEPTLPTTGPDVICKKDDVMLSIYSNLTARLHTAVGMVFMETPPFPFPCDDDKFLWFEGQILAARIGAVSLLGES